MVAGVANLHGDVDVSVRIGMKIEIQIRRQERGGVKVKVHRAQALNERDVIGNLARHHVGEQQVIDRFPGMNLLAHQTDGERRDQFAIATKVNAG